METRNLALMFGPSIVRPSDDNMATMVTHMSDQCKIIESFITYVCFYFNDSFRSISSNYFKIIFSFEAIKN